MYVIETATKNPVAAKNTHVCSNTCVVSAKLAPINLAMKRVANATPHLYGGVFVGLRIQFPYFPNFRSILFLSLQLLGTMYYRAPEVLMGDKMYNTKVDMWATGCIFAELLTNQVCFHNESSVGMLVDIFGIFGTPDEERWVEVSTLEGYIHEYKVDGSGIETLVPEVEGVALDLLSRLLCLYPDERISALDALEH
ncbi:hypothetical protein LguiA_005601 [Lonicera macranthoides]